MTKLNWRRVLRVFQKEAREGARDRSLIIGVVLVPLFLYPLLGFAAFQVLQVIQGISQETPTRIAVAGELPQFVRGRLLDRERFELVELPPALSGWGRTPPDAVTARAAQETAWEEGEEPDAILLWRARTETDSALVFVDRSRDRSVAAFEAIEEDVGDWRRDREQTAFEERGLSSGDLELFEVEEESTASATERGQKLLAMILPMILLYMLATGTYYAAIDAVVGERERGTLETLFTAPLSRAEVLVGKYAFVVAASLTALILNLFGMVLFLKFILSIVEGADALRVEVSLPAFALIVLTGVLLAGLISAIMMVALVPVKTYREGQALLSPILIALIVPGLVITGSRDSFELTHAFIPILNAVALFKSVIRGEYPFAAIAVTLLVLVALTIVTVRFAAKILSNDEVLFDPRMTLKQLLTGKGARS